MSEHSRCRPAGHVHEYSADLVVRRRATVADGVVVLDLVDPEGQELPGWQPGAHIDLILGDGLIRQYSLCGGQNEVGVWRVGVLRDPHGRGGSRYIHDNLTAGAQVRVRGPRNHFPLVHAPRYRFIAGGIGVTPIMTMVEEVDRAGLDWNLLFLGRSRPTMAFADDLSDRYDSRVTVWADDENGGLFDLESAFKEPEDETLIYCCGPEPLLTAVEWSWRVPVTESTRS